jgi:hypothetical protein
VRRNENMGDLGIFASKFCVNSKSLKEFDEALRYLRRMDEVINMGETREIVNKLLTVVNPISEAIRGNFSDSTAISEYNVVVILKKRHSKEWLHYKEKIVKLSSKLRTDRFRLSYEDYELLNDIADALDAECANLFRRMSQG